MAQTLVAPSLASPMDFISLMKPRVMSLVVFTAFVGMLASPVHQHPLLLVISLVAIACGAGASGAINQWYDRDIDGVMARTANRPIPAGKILPAEALSLGIVVSLLSVLVLWFSGGMAAALLLAFTIFFYGVVYTIWLKRSTSQNIVIGGAAGAFPPVIGWLAAGGALTFEPVILFAIIFVWTPPHFWALALVRNQEYASVGVPMLPITAGRDATRLQILLYALCLGGVSVLPYFLGMTGMVYGLVAASLGGVFIWRAFRLWITDSDVLSMQLFKFSITYLFLIFLIFAIDVLYLG